MNKIKENQHKLLIDLQKVKNELVSFLNDYPESKILQKFCLREINHLAYSSLIGAFFDNLNQEVIKEMDLPRGKITKIKKKYKIIRKRLKEAKKKEQRIGESKYQKFKGRVKREFADFYIIFQEIEKEVRVGKIKTILKRAEREFRDSYKKETTLSDDLIKSILEAYVSKKEKIPLGTDLDKLMKLTAKKIIPDVSKEIKNVLDRNSKQMLEEQRKTQTGFEKRLYLRWKKAIDSFECLIRVSHESVEEHIKKIQSRIDYSNQDKWLALIKIHARSVHIANEILALLKGGYPDGANARWRSLRELAIISTFLKEHNNELAKRYLDYSVIRSLKEAKHYQNHQKKLRYKPLARGTLKRLEKEAQKLDEKYGDDFGNPYKDYHWIPKKILKNRNFTELEKLVGMDHLHPFYNLACDAVHGGAKGFYRIGLMDDWQDKVHLIGPVNYGLADPLQNSAISLLHTTISILGLEPDFEAIIQMKVINIYIQEIGEAAVKIQRQIEKEEKSK